MSALSPESKNLVSKRLETELATEYAEMHIIQACLAEGDRAMALYFHRMRNGLDNNPNEVAISQSLFRDAIVQIMGCFTTNLEKRNQFLIPQEAFDGLNGWPEFYRWMLDYRDAYAAHNFGIHRMCEATATVNTETGEVVQIGHLQSMHIGPMDDVKTSMHTFISRANDHVGVRINELHAKLLVEVQSMPPDEFAKLGPPRLVIGGPEDLRLSRGKYRKKQTGPQPRNGG